MEKSRNSAEISVVVPAYKCEKCIEELYSRLIAVLEKISGSFEIIFVNDASPENDWEIISSVCKKDKRVKGINFSRNFGIYSRKAVNAVKDMKDNLRYFPVKIRWVGFRSAGVNVEHSSNSERKSSYNIRRLLSLAVDVMLATSNKPLKFVASTGLLISGVAFLFAIYFFIRVLSGDYMISGWPSLIVSVWFLSGIIIMMLGIVGLYVGKTFDETKKKSHYIIRERVNCND